MKHRPFTIQTYFPTGDPRGYRICQIPTRTIQAIYIPRIDLDEVLQERAELSYNGIYFLFHHQDMDETDKNKVYIGESENIANRLRSHRKRKEDWNIAIVFTTISEENQLTKADIKYLENLSFQKATEAERYEINQNIPTKSFVHEARIADLMDMYYSISHILDFLGYPIFRAKINELELRKDNSIYYINTRNANARAFFSEDGMTVLSGSKIADTPTPSFSKEKLLTQLKNSNIIDHKGIFQKDYTFSSPSTAATIVRLASTNGWTNWKTKESKTLDECQAR